MPVEIRRSILLRKFGDMNASAFTDAERHRWASPKKPLARSDIAGRSQSARRAPRASDATPSGDRFGFARCLRQADTRARSTNFFRRKAVRGADLIFS